MTRWQTTPADFIAQMDRKAFMNAVDAVKAQAQDEHRAMRRRRLAEWKRTRSDEHRSAASDLMASWTKDAA